MKINKIVLSTRNRDKLKEIQSILGESKYKLFSLDAFPQTGIVVEDGKTLLENGLKKARAAYHWTHIAAIADDSGLEVDFLNGAPGVFSSRFAGEDASYHDNNLKLIKLLEGVPIEKRQARFRCVAVFGNSTEEFWAEGICEGIILESMKGQKGFGYDPLFYIPHLGKTLAEITAAEKNQISHRGEAFRKLAGLIDHYFQKRLAKG